MKQFLVAGFGSIGQRHAKNLLQLKAGEVSVAEPSAQGFKAAQELFPNTSFRDFDTALKARKYDAVFICTPNHTHVSLALKAASEGMNLFIEKPLSHSLQDVETLEREAAKKNLTVLVGCNLRFYPGLPEIKKLLSEQALGKMFYARVEFGYWLPDWRPQSDYRQSYSARREMGGGIILDAIHELDYASWLLGDLKLKTALVDKVSNLEIDTEDNAEMIFQSSSGALVSMHLDYLQRNYSRSCRIAGEKGTLHWDFNTRQVSHYDAQDKTTKIYEADPNYILNQMYLDETKHFLNCLDGKEKPEQDLTQAKRVLQLALEAQSYFKEGAFTGRHTS